MEKLYRFLTARFFLCLLLLILTLSVNFKYINCYSIKVINQQDVNHQRNNLRYDNNNQKLQFETLQYSKQPLPVSQTSLLWVPQRNTVLSPCPSDEKWIKGRCRKKWW